MAAGPASFDRQRAPSSFSMAQDVGSKTSDNRRRASRFFRRNGSIPSVLADTYSRERIAAPDCISEQTRNAFPRRSPRLSSTLSLEDTSPLRSSDRHARLRYRRHRSPRGPCRRCAASRSHQGARHHRMLAGRHPLRTLLPDAQHRQRFPEPQPLLLAEIGSNRTRRGWPPRR